MSTTPFAPCYALLTVSLLVMGCDQQPDPFIGDSWSTRAGDDPDRGVWINNGLVDPDFTEIDPAFSLSSAEGLPETAPLLTDAARREGVQYLAECALEPDQSLVKVVDGEPMTFDGLLGLAPQWLDGACDQDCQEWVSACLLARTNASGQTVTIWLQADHPAIGHQPSDDYPAYEASFFGNLFDPQPSHHFCRGNVVGPALAQLHGRTCSNAAGGACDFIEYTECEVEERCEWDSVPLGLLGPLGAPTAMNCASGPLADEHVFHTISTYVEVP